jgi:hypothetical protein
MNRQILSLLLFACAGLSACRQSGPSLCPEGLSLDPKASKPNEFVWCHSKDGKRAQYIQFYPGGKSNRQSCEYRDGRPDGPFSAWLPDGKTWITGHYQAGQPDGRWAQWDKAGARVAEGEYRNGRFVAGAPVASSAGCEKMHP